MQVLVEEEDENGIIPVDIDYDICQECDYHPLQHSSWNADSKFKRPYDGRHGFNPKRDTKGRYRRKLVVPLKKGAETFEAGTYLDIEPDDMDTLALNGHWWSNDGITEGDLKALGLTTKNDWKAAREYMAMKKEMWGDSAEDMALLLQMKGWGAETFESESLVEEPDWIPAGDGRALGQQNLDINLSPLHAEGNLKDYNPITMLVLGIIGGIGVALGTQSLVK